MPQLDKITHTLAGAAIAAAHRISPTSSSRRSQSGQQLDRAKAVANESGLDKVGQRVQAYYESKTNGV